MRLQPAVCAYCHIDDSVLTIGINSTRPSFSAAGFAPLIPIFLTLLRPSTDNDLSACDDSTLKD
jgi:hypothetical protein